MAINGAVYNVTDYMDYHPGGWDELLKGAGKDATNMFNEIHKYEIISLKLLRFNHSLLVLQVGELPGVVRSLLSRQAGGWP